MTMKEQIEAALADVNPSTRRGHQDHAGPDHPLGAVQMNVRVSAELRAAFNKRASRDLISQHDALASLIAAYADGYVDRHGIVRDLQGGVKE